VSLLVMKQKITHENISVTAKELRSIRAAKQDISCIKLVPPDNSKQFNIEWDEDAKVTPRAGVVFFAHFLKTSELFDALVADAPLRYTSNNAPNPRDVLGAFVLSALNGQTRYAHINALRNDTIATEAFEMEKMPSEDSVRRALHRLCKDPQATNEWLSRHEHAIIDNLLSVPYIADIDTTIKTIYGEQEGATIGYNPHKPGRPSHAYHTLFLANLRIILHTEVAPGNKSSSGEAMPAIWRFYDDLPKSHRPYLMRGDVGFGNEKNLYECEKRAQNYLFKIRRSPGVRREFDALCRQAQNWTRAGEGWESAESHLQLSGWTRSRRCVFLRRLLRTAPVRPGRARRDEFAFVGELTTAARYEYCVLVTSLGASDLSGAAAARLYRERCDCENVFDELKNQWGWSGYVTQKLLPSALAARLIALVYNWWNVYTRLANPDKHLESIRSRPVLLESVGRQVDSGRERLIRVTPQHSQSAAICTVLTSIHQRLNALSRCTAEQLRHLSRWAIILLMAFEKYAPVSPVSFPLAHIFNPAQT
jgi:hypothetical protein